MWERSSKEVWLNGFVSGMVRYVCVKVVDVQLLRRAVAGPWEVETRGRSGRMTSVVCNDWSVVQTGIRYVLGAVQLATPCSKGRMGDRLYDVSADFADFAQWIHVAPLVKASM